MKFVDLRRMTIAAYLDAKAYEWSSAFDAHEAIETFTEEVTESITPSVFIINAEADMENWPTCWFGRSARGWISSAHKPSRIAEHAIGHLISAVVEEIHERAQTAHGRMALRAELARLGKLA